MAELYDAIGRDYRVHRRPDPRIAAAIAGALGPAVSVVNVGAGAGSYEPAAPRVLAIEPSLEMIRQRPAGAAPVVRAVAGNLPLRDRSLDAALAVLTVHHCPDRARGLAELGRVARRVVILTWDPGSHGFWLVDDYFPELVATDRKIFPRLGDFRSALGDVEVHTLPVPHDCTDGFLGAYWRRPHAYLDDGVRLAISTFSKIDARPGLARLRGDLDSGAWHRRHGRLLADQELDLGYRLVIRGG